MSTFEITGVVHSATPQTSKQGKAYLTFRMLDGDSIFDLSLFGQSMSFASKLKVGASVDVKGMLTSREYQGKHYPNFQVQWIDAVETTVSKTATADKAAIPAVDFDSIPF